MHCRAALTLLGLASRAWYSNLERERAVRTAAKTQFQLRPARNVHRLLQSSRGAVSSNVRSQVLSLGGTSCRCLGHPSRGSGAPQGLCGAFGTDRNRKNDRPPHCLANPVRTTRRQYPHCVGILAQSDTHKGRIPRNDSDGIRDSVRGYKQTGTPSGTASHALEHAAQGRNFCSPGR